MERGLIRLLSRVKVLAVTMHRASRADGGAWSPTEVGPPGPPQTYMQLNRLTQHSSFLEG